MRFLKNPKIVFYNKLNKVEMSNSSLLFLSLNRLISEICSFANSSLSLPPDINIFIMDALILELKNKIIEVLNLEELTPEDIDENEPLFGTGLALDSIDALELIVLLDKNYGIRLDDPKKGKEIFQSVKTMADYITAHRTK